MNKEKLLDAAEVLDATRTFPRLFCIGYGMLMAYVTVWYCDLIAPDAGQTAFTATVYGAASVILKFYLDGGYDWAQRRKDRYDHSTTRLD